MTKIFLMPLIIFGTLSAQIKSEFKFLDAYIGYLNELSYYFQTPNYKKGEDFGKVFEIIELRKSMCKKAKKSLEKCDDTISTPEMNKILENSISVSTNMIENLDSQSTMLQKMIDGQVNNGEAQKINASLMVGVNDYFETIYENSKEVAARIMIEIPQDKSNPKHIVSYIPLTSLERKNLVAKLRECYGKKTKVKEPNLLRSAEGLDWILSDTNAFKSLEDKK